MSILKDGIFFQQTATYTYNTYIHVFIVIQLPFIFLICVLSGKCVYILSRSSRANLKHFYKYICTHACYQICTPSTDKCMYLYVYHSRVHVEKVTHKHMKDISIKVMLLNKLEVESEILNAYYNE